jgi:hypothetical protein
MTSVKEKFKSKTNIPFTPIPIRLLKLQGELELNSNSFIVLINLMSYWRKSNNIVYPSTNTLSERIGITRRSVQIALKQLADKKIIIRLLPIDLPWEMQGEFVKAARYYSLEPIIELLKYPKLST